MNAKERMKSLGEWLGRCLFIIALICFIALVLIQILVVFYRGAAWASEKLLPWFSILSLITFGLVVLIILPLAIPKATRGFSIGALFIASYVFGATLWMESLLLALSIWGMGWVVIGLILGGVGIIPIAMLATLIEGMWGPLIELALLTIVTFGARVGAISLAVSLEGS